MHHTNSDSWIYDLLSSAALRSENCFEESDCGALESSLAECKTTSEKELVLRHSFPTTFICFLKSMNRYQEFFDLFGKKQTAGSYTWYLHSEVYPKLFRLKAEGKINEPEKTAFSNLTWGGKDVKIDGKDFNYQGQTNLQGNPCGRGTCVDRNKNSYECTIFEGSM